ncbi:Asp/Glu racemase [Burkholderia multivorans]|uniref:maleate cis-trans isomerase family protein n=1 Tax=Burkholderia multivorans TaxID=87883 RepID=UPI0002782689|nr:Asp/Glu racemase [Burkholderia multivorans]AIO72731.1 asp/Glu/Hydantoin racemase family protein [Burkholderia multivorans]AOK64758.1 Asp/Glu racemase [Burkholderia multivorans]EJO52678.1 Asp/Glu/Hydantoin racemase [Burkholderia multivorans CF2]KVQ78425.1 Asp/Glu racemase [Burkholderia multivorans]KVZ82855.1 Asp/Glu racemase [Burkholderia multivorans]
MSKTYRIGQIVPSSNTTMETEIPAMLRLRETIRPERFTYHSSRMRMKQVVKEELAAMDAESDRCAVELSDARVDVLGYACLVAIMAMGHGYHRVSQARLTEQTADNGARAPVLTSAGALVDALRVIGAKRIVVVAPYMKPLTELVVDYIRNEGYDVIAYRALEIPDNLEVGRHDPARLPDIVKTLPYQDADAIVLSACVQMPSLPAVAKVEAMTGKPVITAAIATTYAMLRELDLEPIVPGAGALLSGAY